MFKGYAPHIRVLSVISNYTCKTCDKLVGYIFFFFIVDLFYLNMVYIILQQARNKYLNKYIYLLKMYEKDSYI